jgi:hypothetical protein
VQTAAVDSLQLLFAQRVPIVKDRNIKKRDFYLLIVLIGLAALGLVVVLFGVGIYNKLVGLRNRFKNAYAQIDVQLKRRYDLIPNLVETAKGYLQHERGTLEAVIAARNAAASANTGAAANPGEPDAMKQLASAEGTLSRHARPLVRALRGVSRPQSEHDHAEPDGRTDLDGEQSLFRPAGV